jgi:hypothetical protein
MWIYGETPGKFHTSTGGEVAVVSPAEAAEGRAFMEAPDRLVGQDIDVSAKTRLPVSRAEFEALKAEVARLTSAGSALDEIERGREKLKKMKGGG